MNDLNDNYYFHAIKADIPSHKKFIADLHLAHPHKFAYGRRDYKQFLQHYEPEGWLGRKIIAIPAAAWSIMIKTIVHLIGAIFIGLPCASFDRGDYFITSIFCVLRDLEEAAGRIISLGNDKLGLYLIQESQLQKTCYSFHPSH